MNTPVTAATARRRRDWRLLVEEAIFATDVESFPRRIQEAQDAIMDEIEDSFQTASQSERRSLLDAMNTIRTLRISREMSIPSHPLGNAA